VAKSVLRLIEVNTPPPCIQIETNFRNEVYEVLLGTKGGWT